MALILKSDASECLNLCWPNDIVWPGDFVFCNLLQIVVEEFLEDINNMLNSGEVPNLFEKDELKQVLAAISPKAKEAGISEGNRDEVCDTTNNHLISQHDLKQNIVQIVTIYSQLVYCSV